MALNAYQTLINQTANKRALSGEEQERLRQIAAQQGAAAASSAYLANQNAQQTAVPDYVAASKAKSAANRAIIGGATAGQSVQTQNAYQKALANAQPTVTPGSYQPAPVDIVYQGTNRNTSSGDPVSPAVQAALGTPQPAASAGGANTGLSNAPTMNGNYIWYSWMGDNNMTTMNDQDKANWNTAMKGWQNGDYSAFNDNFQTNGNWASYVDDKGNVNGMLRYVGDGVGGYVPVNGGQLLQNGFSGDLGNYAFYGPDGSVYTADANGRLTKAGTWTADYDKMMKNGYYYNNPDRYFQGKDGQFYTYGDVPDDKLAEWGYVRRNDGIFYEPQTIATNNALKNGDITPEQLAMAQAMRNGNPGNMPSAPANVPSNTSSNTPSGGSSYSSSSSQPAQPAVTPGSYQPAPGDTVYKGGDTNAQNIYQQYMDQWDYPEAPQWEGSEYQQRRDDALKRAEDMRWNYDPNTDPVWQALQKQYRREGDRATQEALAQAAMRTGGLANSYAATAASQAGDYYAAQLSDRLPQLYQDAYNRYLQEFQRQMGISDQYQGFDDREYNRFGDRLQQYNTDRNFDYNRYRDAVGDYRYDDTTAYNRNYQAQRDAISDQRYDQEWAQKMRAYADEQNWKATEWQQYLREYGNKMSQQEREWAYKQYRDAVGDQQYADQQAQNERKYADALAQQEWENSLTEDKYNRSVEDTARSQAEERALRYAALGNYGPLAELWGMTEDEVAAYINGQQGGLDGGNSGGGGGSGGGGYTGGGYTGVGNDYGGGDVIKGGVYDVDGQPMTTESGIIHDTNHEPMTSGFREWWPTLRDAFDAGASSQELAQAVDTLYRNGIIAEYEIDVILDKLGLDSTNPLTQKVQNKIYDTKQAAKRAKSGESAIDNLTSKIKSKIAEAKSKNGG